jgi:hypothetical protein
MILNRIALATLLATGAGLMAQDARFGVQVQVSIPQGDLKDLVDSKLGLGAGVHGTFAFDQHAIRPRLDYVFYPEAEVTSTSVSAKNKVSSLSLGADYLYFVDAKDNGIYFTGGLSAIRWNTDITLKGMNTVSADTTKLGVAVGLGYQWNKSVGTEIRYITSSLSSNVSANSINLGATFRF